MGKGRGKGKSKVQKKKTGPRAAKAKCLTTVAREETRTFAICEQLEASVEETVALVNVNKTSLQLVYKSYPLLAELIAAKFGCIRDEKKLEAHKSSGAKRVLP